MKLKKLLSIVGLGLFAGVSALAGVALAHQKAESVKAATEETTFYVDVQNSLWGYSNIDNVKIHLWGESAGDVYIYDAGTGLSKVTVKGVDYVSFSIADHEGVTGFDVYCWDKTSAGNSTVWTEFSAFTEGQNLITVGNNGDWNANQPVTLGTLDLGTTYNVTKYVVLDGTLDPTPIGTDEVGEGNTYDVPAKPALQNLQHFDGWYVDEDCSEAYTATVINADLNLYAKVESLLVDSYFYWTDKDSADLKDGRLYFFGDYSNSWDEGAFVSNYAISGGSLSFNNEGCLYKIPVPSKGDYKVVIHNGDVQTFDMDITLRAVHYTAFDNTGGDGKHYYHYSADALMGLAADFLVEAETIRNAATYKGLNYSACGISKADAQYLVGLYNALDDDVRLVVDNSFAYTYNPEKSADEQVEPYDEKYVSYRDIMVLLAEKFELSIPGLEPRFTNDPNSIKNTTTFVIVITLITVASIAISSIIVISNKRKEN